MQKTQIQKILFSKASSLAPMVAVLALVLGAGSAQALTGSGTITLRGDVVGTNSYTDPTNTNQPGASYLELQYARARFDGKAGDHYSGILMMDFLQSVATPGYTAGASSPDILKVYEVDDALNDNLSVGIGRLLDPGTGGHEAIRPFYDNWFFSQSYNANFPLGIQVDYAPVATQKIKLLVLNQGWDDGSLGGRTTYSSSTTQLNNSNSTSNAAGSLSGNQTTLGYGARYMGTFGDFDVLGSYHIAPTSGYTIVNGGTKMVESGNNTNNYAVLGVGYNWEGLRVTVDYTNIMFNGIGTQNLDAGSKNTALLMAQYKIGSWMPRLKVESSTVTDVPGAYFNPNGNISNWWGDSATTLFGTNATTTTGPSGGYTDQITRIDVGCDYRHQQDDPFYYSVHYISSTQSFSGGGLAAGFKNTTINESAVYLSMIGKADLFGGK